MDHHPICIRLQKADLFASKKERVRGKERFIERKRERDIHCLQKEGENSRLAFEIREEDDVCSSGRP